MMPREPAVNSHAGNSCPAPPHAVGSGVDAVLETLAGLELGLRRFANLHRLAGPRIAAGRCLAPRAGESAEADQAHFVATLQSIADHIEHALYRSGSITPAEASRVRDPADKLLLVHLC